MFFLCFVVFSLKYINKISKKLAENNALPYIDLNQCCVISLPTVSPNRIAKNVDSATKPQC